MKNIKCRMLTLPNRNIVEERLIKIIRKNKIIRGKNYLRNWVEPFVCPVCKFEMFALTNDSRDYEEQLMYKFVLHITKHVRLDGTHLKLYQNIVGDNYAKRFFKNEIDRCSNVIYNMKNRLLIIEENKNVCEALK